MYKPILASTLAGTLLLGACTGTTVHGSAPKAATPAAKAAAPTTPPTTTATPSVGAPLTVRYGSIAATVTPVRLIDPATPIAGITPPAGTRLVGIEVRITAVSGTYSDNANVDLTVRGSDEQIRDAAMLPITECTDFDGGDFTIPPGQSVVGCVSFALPTGVNLADFFFTPEGGLGFEHTVSAEWRVEP